MTLKIGMFGTGIMAKIYAQILAANPLAELVGVVGNTPESTKEFADTFGIAGYPKSNYQGFLDAHSVDALILATPEWVRDQPMQVATKAKKHLLLEKPFAASWPSARSYAEMLRNYPGVVQLCHVLRFSPRFFAMKEAIAKGEIGDVRHIFARRNSNNVRAQRVLGKTDLAFWLTPHDVDIMRWITGSEVKSVSVMSRGRLDSPDDYIIASFRFANGVDAVLEISWCSPPVNGLAREALFEVRGTKGVIELNDAAMNVAIFGEGSVAKSPDTYEDYVVQGQHHGFFRNLIDGFVTNCSERRIDKGAVDDALETIRACAMVRKSVDERRAVSREEFG